MPKTTIPHLSETEDEDIIIKYKLADGQIVGVDVSREVAEALAEFDRKEASWNRKMRRHRVLSIEALSAESAWEPTDRTSNAEDGYIAAEERESVRKAFANLNKEQKQLIYTLYVLNISARELASRRHITYQAVYKQLNKALGLSGITIGAGINIDRKSFDISFGIGLAPVAIVIGVVAIVVTGGMAIDWVSTMFSQIFAVA